MRSTSRIATVSVVVVAGLASPGVAFGPPVVPFAGSGADDGVWSEGAPRLSARLYAPSGIASAPDGTVYVSDYYGYRVVKISPSGICTTFAGNGYGGNTGDGGPAHLAQLTCPTGLLVEPAGTLLIADTGNHRIRRVELSGIITTVVGSGRMGYDGDGKPATQAALYDPIGLTSLLDGTLVFADTDNARIRAVGPDGMIRTVAGVGTWGYGGDGGPAVAATLDRPHRVRAAPDGSIYVSDTYNHRLRQITPAGLIRTVAGTGQRSSSGVPGPAWKAGLRFPRGLLMGTDGSVYVADTGNMRVLRLLPTGELTVVVGPDVAVPDGDLPKGWKGESPVGRPADLAWLQDSLLIVDGASDRVWRIAPGAHW